MMRVTEMIRNQVYFLTLSNSKLQCSLTMAKDLPSITRWYGRSMSSADSFLGEKKGRGNKGEGERRARGRDSFKMVCTHSNTVHILKLPGKHAGVWHCPLVYSLH